LRALDAVRDVERELGAAGVGAPRTDAEILVAHVLGVPRSVLRADGRELAPEALSSLRELTDRRRKREPLQHIVGEWGFRRLTLSVDGRALVPRPETEVVVERCLTLLGELPAPRVLDVGTGSGAIALALADEHPGARVIAVDVDADALALARENAARTGLADRIELVEGDLFAGASGPFDLVVANPPYVRADEVDALEPEVRDHDPRRALVGPGVTDAIARGARGMLGPGGWLVLEVGDGQADEVAAFLGQLGYRDVAVTPDLAGTPRVVEGRSA
jgi:release factor glutamine methyltransferase